MTTDSRLYALRALLAKHEPTPDDVRVGHTYRYETPSEKVRPTWQARAAAILRSMSRRTA